MFISSFTRNHARLRSCQLISFSLDFVTRHMKGAIPILLVAPLLSACATQRSEVWRSFDGSNISRVILRASAAAGASEVNLPPSSPAVQIFGVPYVRANARAEPLSRSDASSARPRPAFVARQFGHTLVISTTNEVRYPERDYYMEVIHLWISLPVNIHVIREARPLTSDGSPDLSPP